MSALEHATDALALADTLRADDPFYAACIRVAQVHATLALAEEQRTANLIALANSEPVPMNVDRRTLLIEAARRMGALP